MVVLLNLIEWIVMKLNVVEEIINMKILVNHKVEIIDLEIVIEVYRKK
jgi:hypothetical protein